MQVYDWESSGKHNLFGTVKTTIAELQCTETQRSKEFKLMSKGSKTGATMTVENMELYERPSFMDFLNGGLEIGFNIAIDFTGSNKPPMRPDSLHSLESNPNQYEQAIQAVGAILDHYNVHRSACTSPNTVNSSWAMIVANVLLPANMMPLRWCILCTAHSRAPRCTSRGLCMHAGSIQLMCLALYLLVAKGQITAIR
jgi:hypothetical protein